MKKILFFLCITSLLMSCEPADPEYEFIYPDTQQNDPNDNDGDNGDVPNSEPRLEIKGQTLWNSGLGFLMFTETEALFPEGMNPTYVAVRLFENGRELQPTGYWMFEEKKGNTVWYRPAQMELLAGQIETGHLQVQLFAMTAESNGFQLLDQKNVDITMARPSEVTRDESIPKGLFIPAPPTTLKD